MKKLFTTFVLGVFLLSLGACIRTSDFYRTPHHPPPRTRAKSRPPARGYIWVKGHWRWQRGRWVWRNGYWIAPKRGHRWVPGHYERRRGRDVWVPGHWRRRR